MAGVVFGWLLLAWSTVLWAGCGVGGCWRGWLAGVEQNRCMGRQIVDDAGGAGARVCGGLVKWVCGFGIIAWGLILSCESHFSKGVDVLNKRTVSKLVLALGLVLGSGSLALADVTVVDKGQPKAKIYVTGPLKVAELKIKELNALSDSEKEARELAKQRGELIADLNYHIKKMSGFELEVVETGDPAQVKGPALVVGPLATKMGATAKETTPNGEAFRLLVKGDLALMGGESDVASRHAVYELLRRLGCDWIMPGAEGEIIPNLPGLVIKDMDVALKPDFQVRASWYSGGSPIIEKEEFAEYIVWLKRQQQTTRDQKFPALFLSGGHYWDSLLRTYKAVLDADPSMRAQVRQLDGTIKPGTTQLDAANPKVVDLTVNDIKAQYKKSGWANDHAYTKSIGPNDGGGYSISAESFAAGADRVDPMTGDRDQTDVLINYLNQVVTRLKPEYPNFRAGYLIYSVHADYPQKYVPDPSLVFTFADITYSRYHSLLDRRSTTRAYYKSILDQWKALHEKQGNTYWYYGYNWNLAENLMPYSKMKIWGQDLPYYYSMGVLGHNNEQDKGWAILGPHNYLMARMGWDIKLDWKKVLTEYCAKAFGDGGPAMEKYYLMLIEQQESAGQEAGSFHAIGLIFDRAFVAKSKALFQEAKAAAKTDIQKKRVDYFSEPVQMLELYLNYREATYKFDFVEAQKQFDGMVALWENYYKQNPNLVSKYGYRYITRWLIKPYVTQAVKYSTGDYKIVHRLPDELKTAFDPHTKGAEMGMYRPEVSDKTWLKTKTYTSTWDAQGMGPYRPGSVWYRDTFTAPKELAEGQGMGLSIGAVEDTAQVWLNGEYLGMGKGFMVPFQFDLSKHIKLGQENTIAIQVIRRNLLNESGVGGLFYPSFVFVGPKLEKPAPANEPARRILPGGSFGEIEK
jgi:hypothetical protein